MMLTVLVVKVIRAGTWIMKSREICEWGQGCYFCMGQEVDSVELLCLGNTTLLYLSNPVFFSCLLVCLAVCLA